MTIKTILEFSPDFDGAVEASIEAIYAINNRVQEGGSAEADLRERLEGMKELDGLKKKRAQHKFSTRNFGVKR